MNDLQSRTPRWSCGNPRMLLLIVLVREFESRRGEISNLFAKKRKKKKGSTAESAYISCVSTTRREPTREELKSSRDKNVRHGS